MQQTQRKNPGDLFRVRCFHLAYKLLNGMYDGTMRFITALSQTSDDIIDLNDPRMKAGYERWYSDFYLKDKSIWRKKHGKDK